MGYTANFRNEIRYEHIHEKKGNGSVGKWTTLDTATEFYSMMHPAGSVVLAFENMANKVEYALNAYDKKYGGGDGKSWVILDGPVINAEDCTTPIKIIEKFK